MRISLVHRYGLVLRSLPLLVSTLCLGLLVAGCAAEPELPGSGDDVGKTVVYRDTWGVPHIYAPTVTAGLYAQGWAQAEDRPEQLLLNLLMGIGEYSSVAGEDGVQVDLRSHMWDHYGVAREGWEEIRPELREHLEAFARGINDYYAAHPEDVPEWWSGRQVDPYMLVAFGRLFLYNWSIDEAYDDLRRAGIEPGQEPAQRGSNQFAISPSRSAQGASILAIDPHLSWHGPSRFWEFRIHAGELEGSGVTLPGSPYIGVGHTRYLAWAMTTGGPDTADVYELTLREGDPHSYRYEGEWRQMTSREVALEVEGASEPEKHTLWFSHHGPVIAWQGDKAYAAKTSYADIAAVNEAWYELNFGTDYEGAVRGMATLTVFPQNVMVADTAGNIYYQRTGRVPRRPAGYDWTVPVDGSTAATEWDGLHPASDHLQVLNPPQGYMQNCNIPPDAMMVDSPFELEEHLPYIYSSRDYGPRSGWTNQRGARAVELLAADDSVTAEEARAYVTDVHPYGVERWLEALRRADEAHGESQAAHAHYGEALADLMAWDQELRADSSGGLKYDYWRHQLAEDLDEEALRELTSGIDDWYAVVTPEEPAPTDVSEQEQAILVASFARAMERLVEHHGSLDAVYGDRYRVGRGEESWPVGGGGGRVGTTTLRNMGYGPEREDHTRWGRSGQTSTQVVVLTDPPRSWIYLPLGQSDRPDSPHYADQAEKLFSQRQLKPSWWLPEDLAGNVESRVELAGAPGGSET